MRGDLRRRLEKAERKLAPPVLSTHERLHAGCLRLERAGLDEAELLALVEARDVVRVAQDEGRALAWEMFADGGEALRRAHRKMQEADAHAS